VEEDNGGEEEEKKRTETERDQQNGHLDFWGERTRPAGENTNLSIVEESTNAAQPQVHPRVLDPARAAGGKVLTFIHPSMNRDDTRKDNPITRGIEREPSRY